MGSLQKVYELYLTDKYKQSKGYWSCFEDLRCSLPKYPLKLFTNVPFHRFSYPFLLGTWEDFIFHLLEVKCSHMTCFGNDLGMIFLGKKNFKNYSVFCYILFSFYHDNWQILVQGLLH